MSDSSHLEAATIRHSVRSASQINESLALNVVPCPDSRHVFECDSEDCSYRKSCMIRLIADTSVDNADRDLRVAALLVEFRPDFGLRNKQ